MSHSFTNWRAVRKWESALVQDLRQRRWLRLHGFWIGLLVLLVTWGVSALQMRLGVGSLALRYLISLGVGYAVYLLTLRLWAAALLGHFRPDMPDLANLDLPGGSSGATRSSLSALRSGQGGDFGGGGASGDFASDLPGVPDGVADLAGGALEAATGSDEAAVVVVPLVALFLIACALIFGVGSLLLLYFGWEVLLAVAVEIAFSYASARAAVRVTRAGWASAALRLTWKPLAGALICAVTLGATIDYFIPNANSLPQAIKVLKAQFASQAQAHRQCLAAA